MAADGISIPSTKPYLIRALHEWCSDNGFTPFIAVFVDGRVEVPMEFVKNDEIVLNLSSEACHQLDLGNEWVSFQARFGGVPKRVMVPVTHVLAIYARENGQGMSFQFDGAKTPDPSNASEGASDAPKKPRPSLTIVK
jgi:stringent starvation protein B